MNNKEMQFAYKVKLALDANLDNLSDDTLQSLSAARRVALARKKRHRSTNAWSSRCWPAPSVAP
jgi:hypothetical protein